MVFALSLNTALLCQSAHESYEAINSFYVSQENSLSTKKKLKILNFLERLSGPKIAVYVLDLFPLNYYEFYLLIAAIASNFFLAISWLEGF